MKKKKLLVVVDMQNDFIDGALGTKEAQGIVENVCEVIGNFEKMDIAVTLDTHNEDYLSTQEGKNLPVPHCIYNEQGHELNAMVKDKLASLKKTDIRYFSKNTFGSTGLGRYTKSRRYSKITIVGLCSDICVISNALLLKSFCPEAEIEVVEWCTAGVTKESHDRAIKAMEMCQIKVLYKEK